MSFEAATPSVDGKRIFAVGDQDRGELVRYDSKTRQFTADLSGISASAVSFSPNGRWVAYSTYPENILWRSRTDDSEKLQLTYKPLRAFGSNWSPDGTQILFAAEEAGQNARLYSVPVEGGAPRMISASEHDLIFPKWTPDGKSIVFEETSHYTTFIKLLDLKTKQVSTLPGSEI